MVYIVAAEELGDINGLLQKIDAALAFIAVPGNEGWLMLYVPVEQESRAGFDDRLHPPAIDCCFEARSLNQPVIRIRIERPMIESQSHALVANLGQERKSLERIVMSKPVNVVAQTHGAIFGFVVAAEQRGAECIALQQVLKNATQETEQAREASRSQTSLA